MRDSLLLARLRTIFLPAQLQDFTSEGEADFPGTLNCGQGLPGTVGRQMPPRDITLPTGAKLRTGTRIRQSPARRATKQVPCCRTHRKLLYYFPLSARPRIVMDERSFQRLLRRTVAIPVILLVLLAVTLLAEILTLTK